MNENWERIQSIFHQAADLRPEERAPFLDSACGGDSALRNEVESLLAHDSAGEQIADALQGAAQSLIETVHIKPGTRVGDYEVIKLIGSGGMGEVFRARDVRLARNVAIKVLPSYLSKDPDRLRRFEQEARAAAALNHPNILVVYQMGSYEGAPYLVSELLEGQTLGQLIKRGPLPSRDAVEYGVQISRGLAAAHGKGITHRDLKPENLFVTKDGHVKILDFGLAKLAEPPSSTDAGPSTAFGLVMGTVGYMSPEQVRGQTVDHRSDFFAFGAIFYEMLSGQRAFKKETAAETMTAILNEEPPSISQLSPNTPPALQRVLRRCLEKNREQRFQTASDLAFALEALSDSEVQVSLAGESSTVRAARPSWLPMTIRIAVSVVLLSLAYYFRPAMPVPHVSRVVQLTKDRGAAPGEPLYTDGPRVYYHPLADDWQLRQVLLNGNQDTPVGLPAGRFRIRGLSPDDSEFVAISLQAGHFPVWRIPVGGGSPRRLGELLADDIAWSHDGNWFAYSQGNQLLLARSDGTSARTLATMSDASAGVARMRWSPDDRRISFTLIGETTVSLWEIGADGRNLHELRFDWPGAPHECCGEWTPDGRYFVFKSSREGIGNLWALQEKSDWWRRASHDPIQLTSGPVSYFQPVPSRNSMGIFAIGIQASGELMRYDAGRKDFLPFLGGRAISHLAFSRDGRWVAYVAYPEWTLWRARIDGTEPLQLTFPPLQVGSPSWSADGKHIAFHALQPGQLRKNYVISSEGGNPEPFPPESLSQASPGWMPDRDALIYSRDYGAENPALYLFDRQTARNEKIPGTEGLFGTIWSPNGHYLLSTDASTDRLLLVDLKSSKRTQISGPAAWPAWSPDSQYVYFLRWGFDWIFRVRIPDGQEEKFLQVPFRMGSWPFAVAPDGTVLVLRENGRYDVYSLSLSVQ